MGVPGKPFSQGGVRREAALSTLVAVGNCYQSFHRLLEEVERLAAAGLLPAPVIIQHGHTEARAPHCRLIPFLSRDEFAATLGGSKLLISHAGSGTLLEGMRLGMVPVVMPRLASEGEHIDDHQCETAAALEKGGKVEVAWQTRELATAVERALRRQASRPRRVAGRQSSLVPVIRDILRQYARDFRREEASGS